MSRFVEGPKRGLIVFGLMLIATSQVAFPGPVAVHGARAVSAAGTGSVTQFGVAFDGPRGIIPNVAQLTQLGATWERSVVGTHLVTKHRPPKDTCSGDPPTLTRLFSPGFEWLMTFNNQSCGWASQGPLKQPHNGSLWNSYIDRHYIPNLIAFMNSNSAALVAQGRGAAFEIWNEEDCPQNHSYIDPLIYASMLSKAARAINAWNLAHGGTIQTVMGGLCMPGLGIAAKTQYLDQVLSSGIPSLRLVSAIGVHPTYGQILPRNVTVELDTVRQIIQNHASITGNHEVWVTETGTPGGTDQTAREDQAHFAHHLLETLVADNVPVVIWYTFSDRMATQIGLNWGLYDRCDVLKPVGAVFEEFARNLQFRPPIGSTTQIDVTGLKLGSTAINVKVGVTVGCPSGAEVPSAAVALTDRSDTSMHTQTRGLSKNGSALFSLALGPGTQSIIAQYPGDPFLESGRSSLINFTFAQCPGSPTPEVKANVDCDAGTDEGRDGNCR